MDLRTVLADLTLAVHAIYILFVVGGQLLILAGWARGWSWTRHRLFRQLHLVAIGFVVLEAWFGLACPLTTLENTLRSSNMAHENGFVRHWLQRLIFYIAPEWMFTLAYTVFAGVVVLTWLAYPPRRKL